MRPSSLPVSLGLVLATLWTIHAFPQLTSVLLLVFAGVIVAVLLNALSTTWQRILPGGHAPAYAAALVCVVLGFTAVGVLVGPQLADEVPELIKRMPEAWDTVVSKLSDYAVLDSMTDKARQPFNWLRSNTQILSLLSTTFGVLVNVFVVVFVGLYAAAAPGRYLNLGRTLLPANKQRAAAGLARDLGRELRHWMLARASSMAIVGAATGFGLWLLGVPLAFTLGLLAGLLSFVPYIGPILGLIPALLIAAVQSLVLAGWVLLLFAVVQLVETTLLTPLIQQRAIALPPVILITVQLIGGVLIGPLGVLLAAPLVVCGMVVASWHYHGAEAG